jgi:hypothetical protein
VHVEKVPVPLVDSAMVPVGVEKGAGDVSVTVTVHLVELFAKVMVGLQENAMLVVRSVTVTLLLIPLLDECIASPP